MAWQLLSSGTTAEEFQANAPEVGLSKGTKMRLELTTTVPIAPLADLWGAEWIVSKMLNEADVLVTDVEGVGWNKVMVHMEAQGSPVPWVPIIIAVIVAICIYFGISLFRELRLFAEAVSPVMWGIIALIGAAIAVPIIMSLFKKKPKKEGG